MDITTVTALLSGPALLILREIAGWYISQRKAKHEEDLSQTEQAVRLYKEILDNLRSDVSANEKKIQEVLANHIKCQEENAILKAEVIELKRRVADLEKHNGNGK